VRAGFADRGALAAALGFGAVNCAASALLLPCTRLFKRAGGRRRSRRRVLLLIALPLMALCLAGVAISFAAMPTGAQTTGAINATVANGTADSASQHHHHHVAVPVGASAANSSRFANGGGGGGVGGGGEGAGGLSDHAYRDKVRAACVMLGMYIFGAAHALGAGTVPAVYAAEAFAPAVRAQGVGLGQLPSP
jgi:hypothetical protein